MKTMKKLLALILALMLCLALFVGCGDNNSDDISNDDSNAVGDSSDTVATGFYDADGNLLLGPDDVFMTINGYEITFDEYRYWYNMIDSYYFSGGDASFWESYPSYFDVLLEYTEYYILESNWANLLAEPYGVELTDEDYAEIETYLAEEKAYFETEDEYYEALEAAGFGEDLLIKIITNQVLSNRVYADLYCDEGAKLAPSDEELKETVNSEYVRVYHVLVAYDHFDGLEGYEDYTDEELEDAAYNYALELLAQIQNGEADIYTLAQEVGDDPGMVDNEAGYLFTTGEMVQEFEDASFALEVGEISELVQSESYGWFIIERLEQEEYVENNWETVRETLVNNVFNSDIDELLENAIIVYNDAYEYFTYNSVK